MALAHPHLIFCGLSGFGSDGPRGGQKTFDMVVQGLSGVMALTANSHGEPRKIAMSVADLLGGCSAALGIAAGLLARTRDGRGQFVDTALFDITVWTTQDSWGRADAVARDRTPSVATLDGFLVIDGDLAMAADLLDGGREQGNAAPIERIAAFTASRRGVDLELLCARLGVPALVPRRIDEVAVAAQTTARDMLVDVVYDAERVRVLNSPFSFSRTESRVRAAAPAPGEHADYMAQLLSQSVDSVISDI
jgi:crotonobetainyl-CoA:carnitine CoA-transferase CaiB-like acyl-CoA transferase